MTPTLGLVLACLAAVAGLLYAEYRGKRFARVVLKLCASTAFVLLAAVLGAHESTYGQFILAALVLGWLGDALLLSDNSRLFMAGLGAFLASHLCFAAAFIAGGFSLPSFGLAALPAVIAGGAIARWLWPHLSADFKAPVVAYVVAILFMCAAAAGFAAATGVWRALAGAVLFAASDIAVARDRFVLKSFTNKLWGLPVYFIAQLVLASSVAVA
ncbi:MAG: lysoplasmalogenase [Gammaproteobacteria bacterium]|nr:lysoplasmalogenase [Gammaproteobacteria bacterium]MBU1416297.1 lysoplasmalogenase [Gammaproteobacteria bacterium]